LSSLGFEQMFGLWEDGTRRLREVDDGDRRAVERAIEEVVFELRRRVGGTFTTDELARYYLEQGTDWCFDLAVRVAPESPAAWDMTMVAGAAFARYVRLASDYGGGKRLEHEP
jgi:hypothetical protein